VPGTVRTVDRRGSFGPYLATVKAGPMVVVDLPDGTQLGAHYRALAGERGAPLDTGTVGVVVGPGGHSVGCAWLRRLYSATLSQNRGLAGATANLAIEDAVRSVLDQTWVGGRPLTKVATDLT
jgi:hypothetical protein